MRSCLHFSVVILTAVGASGCIPETSPNIRATHLQFLAQPASAPSTESLGVVTVALLDSANDVVKSANASVEIALAGGDTAATLLHASTVAATNGIARFTGLAVDKAAAGYRLVARSAGLDSALSATFTVRAGIAGAVSFDGAPMTAQVAGVPLPEVRVFITDLAGNVDHTSTASVTLSLLEDPPSTSGPTALYGTKTRAAVAGVVRFNDIAIQRAALGYSLKASGEGLRPDTSSAFEVRPGPISFLQFSGIDAGHVSDTVTTVVWQVDEYGNWPNPLETAPAVPVTLSLGNNPTGATLGGRLTDTTFRARARFYHLTIDKAGTAYTLIATSPGYRTATSAPFSVVP